jgi:hypothetical protein
MLCPTHEIPDTLAITIVGTSYQEWVTYDGFLFSNSSSRN